jgi:hypothetical protein
MGASYFNYRTRTPVAEAFKDAVAALKTKSSPRSSNLGSGVPLACRMESIRGLTLRPLTGNLDGDASRLEMGRTRAVFARLLLGLRLSSG